MNGIRFAPSPTGRFHVGNLRTAWIASRLAKLLGEPLIIRIEDIDTVRSNDDFRVLQIADLAQLDIHADELIVQSRSSLRHTTLFQQAVAEGRLYPCDCSRRDVVDALAALRSAPHGSEAEYSGRCRHRQLADMNPTHSLAWRWRHAADESGRFDTIVARTDRSGHHFASGYHWACAIDDADGDYRLLVRAWDLETAERTQKQIRNWVRPESMCTVFHTSLVCRPDGGRLEKRTNGVTLSELINDGWGPERLIAAFQNSFEVNSVNIHHFINKNGEDARYLSIEQLLL